LVHDEHNGDVLFSHDLLVLDLSSCLNYVVYGLGSWLLTLIDADFVCSVAELAAPDLLVFILYELIVLLGLELLLFNFTVNIEYSIALFAENGVTSCDFCIVFKSTKCNFEYICVDLLLELSVCLWLLRGLFLFDSDSLLLSLILVA
jgi:hypothetical protein